MGSTEIDRAGRGSEDGAAEDPAAAMAQGERTLAALDALIDARAGDSQQAMRYRERVRFALDRVEDLQRLAERDGGVFSPARLEISLSILETHVDASAAFARRELQQAKRAPGRAGLREALEDAVAVTQERRAA